MKEGSKGRGKRLLIAGLTVPVLFAVLVLFLQYSESQRVAAQQQRLQSAKADYQAFQFAMLADLPEPVARYFRYALSDGQPFIASVVLSQRGMLRTAISSADWIPFTANQVAAPAAPGFVWQAKVNVRPGFYVSVVDSYHRGVGAGRVSLLGALPVAQAESVAELNAGALHRYLAEAVWYPTALLPQAGVQWTALNDNAAIATLTDNGVTVSLEFRFNDIGEVTGIYTDGRFGQFDGGYRKTPWQGAFANYQLVEGMRVPHYGEVGWIIDGKLELVWKGELDNVRYVFALDQAATSTE